MYLKGVYMSSIKMNSIEEILNSRTTRPIQKFRKAAVMILIEEIDGEEFIIFQVRSSKLNKQPGDVCLPGGKVELEETIKAAAIRETMEELHLSREDFEVIGEMDYFVSPYNLILFPFVAKAKVTIGNITNQEVDHIFKVPIKFFIDNEPTLYNMQIGPINNEDFPYHLIKGDKYKFSTGILEEYFYQWKGYAIWGITAHIIKSFVDIIKTGC